jgi:diadenosine tetraphosphatase ApaH/serine/threonine PP2A family protein phosphatase
MMHREMSMDEYNYLADCPLILDIPELHARVVHGGLDPAITNIIDNDPWSVMNMRLIDGDNKPSKEKLKENPDEDARNWTTAYAEESKDNVTVYYGHDASRGATIGSKTIGLDSGCVYGRQLSVMEMKSQELTQIDCTDRSAEDHDD